MNRLPISHPAIEFLVTFIQGRVQRARAEETSRGASAVEWVIISAVVVTIVGVVAALINDALKGKAEKVGKCIEGTSSNKTC